MKNAKLVPLLLSLFFVFLLVLIFRPVPIPSSDSECLVEKGKVISIYDGGIKDVIFVLENNATSFYINRGLEQGLDLETLRIQLINKEVSIKYPDYWSFLGSKSSIHLSKLELGSEVVFSEF